MLALALTLALAPAEAAELTLRFDAPDAAPALLALGTEKPGLAAVTDTEGDAWLVDVDLLEEDPQGLRLRGEIRLTDVPDTVIRQAFDLRLAWGTPGVIALKDPDGQPRLLTISAMPDKARPVVDCELLVAPTVHELADALQSFVDAGLEPRTGQGEFTVDQGVMPATWVCGW